MKRGVSIFIALVLLLSLIALFAFTGCGGKSNPPTESVQEQEEGLVTENDTGSLGVDSGSKFDWPTAELPSGFSEYPDGTIEDVNTDGGDVRIYISNTERKSFDSYVKSLVNSGWLLDDSEPDAPTL